MFEESNTQASPLTSRETQNVLFTYLGISAAVFFVIAVAFDIARRLHHTQMNKKKKVDTTEELKGEKSINCTAVCFFVA